MAKPKATTLQQKFGFADGELSTPLHDEIMLWLDAYILEAVSIAADIPIELSEWEEVFLEESKGWVSLEKARSIAHDMVARSLEALKAEVSMLESKDCVDLYGDIIRHKRCETDRAEKWAIDYKRPGLLNVYEKIWEYTISSPSKFTIGFVDMMALYEEPYLWLRHFDGLPTFESSLTRKMMAFEVKPKTPSLGELIRQIRMYQSYINCPFCVVSPDDRFKDALASQGIKFLKYTG